MPDWVDRKVHMFWHLAVVDFNVSLVCSALSFVRIPVDPLYWHLLISLSLFYFCFAVLFSFRFTFSEHRQRVANRMPIAYRPGTCTHAHTHLAALSGRVAAFEASEASEAQR
jgi:hypothetical protein